MSEGKYRNYQCYCGSKKKFKRCHQFVRQGWFWHEAEKVWKQKEANVEAV